MFEEALGLPLNSPSINRGTVGGYAECRHHRERFLSSLTSSLVSCRIERHRNYFIASLDILFSEKPRAMSALSFTSGRNVTLCPMMKLAGEKSEAAIVSRE